MACSEILNQQFNRLLDYWGGEFPDYYAGAYIQDNKLHLMFTEVSDSLKETICFITGNFSIVFSKATYSYNDLTKLRDSLIEKIQELINNNTEDIKSFSSIGIDERNNKILIKISVNPKENNPLISLLGEDPRVSYGFQKDPIKQMSSNIMAGFGPVAHNCNNGSSCTISFCASRYTSGGQTEKGFVVAGHLGNVNNLISIGGTNVGRITWKKHYDNCDAAFVCIDSFPGSGYVRSNKLSYNYIIGSTSPVGIVGSTYAMHGSVSGIVYGTVESTSVFQPFTDPNTFVSVQLTDMICMSLHSVEGDSGAPLVKNASGSIKSVIGTLAGGDGYYAYFSKVGNILSVMNGGLY